MTSTPNAAHRPRRRTTMLIAATAAVLALASACGADANVMAEKDAPAPPIELGDGVTPTTRSRSATTAKGISGALAMPFTLDRTAWYEGFKITLTSGAVDAEKEMLKIAGEVENEGPSDGQLYDDVRLEQDSVAVASGHIETDRVLAGSRAAATVEVRDLPATFDPDKAVLVFGDAKHQHVRIPLKGKAAGVTGEPLVLTPPPPEIIAGGLHFTIDKLSIRGDDPKDHAQAPIDSQFVVVEGSVRFDSVSTNVQSQNVSLIPPKGAPQSADHLNALPRNAGSEKIFIVFEMPTPIGGQYTLQVKGNYAYANPKMSPKDPVSIDTTITLPAYPAAGPGS